MLAKFSENGCRLLCWRPFFLCALFFLSHSTFLHAQPLVVADDPVEKLKFATPELSVRLIDDYQPLITEKPAVWFTWEQKRISLLAELGAWQTIVERTSGYDTEPELLAKQWLGLFRARALLKTSEPSAARKQLRQLLWSEDKLTTEQVADARYLIIKSYLAEGKAQDAVRAMHRYRQDYGETGLQWKLLQAKVLLATERYQDTVLLLQKEKDPQLAPLKTLARLRAGLDSEEHIYKKAIETALSLKKNVSDAVRRQNWILAYAAAGIKKDLPAQIEAVENILVTGVSDTDDDLIAITPDLLWQLYDQYALELGNQLRLLIGDDQVWYMQASDRYESETLQARALFALLGARSAEQNRRDVSYQQLAALLEKLQKGQLLMERMFIDSHRFKNMGEIPDAVRYQLLDFSLSRGRIKQAASLFEYLPEPPEGKKRLAWALRRARVLILGGQYQQGQQVLAEILKQPDAIDVQQINRLMQVIFDLQNIDQHQSALDLFTALENHINDPLVKREVKFWQAESLQALKQYTRAAHLYLVSAGLIPEKQNDPWAQTARFKAAEALTQAGLIQDARSLYRELLKNTASEARKASIKQRLQQLWLLEGNRENENT